LGFVEGQFKNAENFYAKALTIPLFVELTDAQQDEVISALETVLGN
jgi:dTDP-4-amino-4,6-dideoxygalactose transaminase